MIRDRSASPLPFFSQMSTEFMSRRRSRFPSPPLPPSGLVNKGLRNKTPGINAKIILCANTRWMAQERFNGSLCAPCFSFFLASTFFSPFFLDCRQVVPRRPLVDWRLAELIFACRHFVEALCNRKDSSILSHRLRFLVLPLFPAYNDNKIFYSTFSPAPLKVLSCFNSIICYIIIFYKSVMTEIY